MQPAARTERLGQPERLHAVLGLDRHLIDVEDAYVAAGLDPAVLLKRLED